MIQKLMDIAKMAHSIESKPHLSIISTLNEILKSKNEIIKKTCGKGHPKVKDQHHQMKRKAVIHPLRKMVSNIACPSPNMGK